MMATSRHYLKTLFRMTLNQPLDINVRPTGPFDRTVPKAV